MRTGIFKTFLLSALLSAAPLLAQVADTLDVRRHYFFKSPVNNQGLPAMFRLYEKANAAGNEYIQFRVPYELSASQSYVLPVNAPTVGQVLTAVSADSLKWSTFTSALTVREVDLNPAISNVGTLEFDQSGFSLSDQGSGVGRLSLAAAVSLLGQSIASSEIVDSTITNADISASAGISPGKLAAGASAQMIVLNGSGIPAYVNISGDATISNTGVITVADDSHAHSNYALSSITLTAGDGLAGGGTLAANRTFSVNFDYDGGLGTGDDSLHIKLWGNTLALSDTGLKVDDNAIGPLQLNESLDYTWFGQHDFSLSEFKEGEPFRFEGDTDNGVFTVFAITDPTSPRTITFPNLSGEVSLLGQTIGSVEIVDSTITNADIAANAGISLAKLAAGTSGQIIVVNGSSAAAYVAMSGDIAISNAGVTTIQDNAVDGGDLSISGETTGDLIYFGGTDWLRLAIGSEGQVLKVTGGALTWGTDASAGNVAVKESNSQVVAAVSALDFGSGFDLSESPAGEINIVLDYTEDPIGLATAEVTGILGLANGGTGADLSATGGTNQFVRQNSVGGVLTVSAIADADVPDTITLTNITQITNRSHSNLSDLTTGDPHTQYTLETTTLSASDGLSGGGDLSTNRSFAVNLDFDGGLESVDDSLNVKIDGATLTRSATGIKVADNAIGPTQIDETTNYILTGQLDFDSAEILSASALRFEGATDDNIYTIFTITDPTSANKTITFPNATGEVTLLGQDIDLSSSEASGILAAARFPALTGDVTTTQGSLSTTIATNAVDGTNIQLASEAQGDLMYADGTDWTRLAKSTTATRYLSNTGSSNNPAWAAVDLSNGVTGTLADINVSNDLTLATVSGAVDLGGATSLEVPNGASVTTDAFGELAADNNAWATNRGALQFYDGSDSTYIVGVQVSDAPNDGDIPKYNSASGTITWEADAGAGGGAPIGATYIVTSLDGTLTNERRLQGTSNEISLADGGANGDLVISLPTTLALSAKELQGGTIFLAEGATANEFEGTFNVADFSADRTITFPDLDGTVTLLGNTTTGTGSIVLATSPSLTSPTIATSISQDGDAADAGYLRLQNAAIIAWEAAPAGTDITLTVDANEIMQVSGTFNAATLTEGGSAVPSATDHLGFFASTTSAQLLGVISDETGSGVLMFATSPTITTDITIPNTGLHLLDTNGSHDLIVVPGSDLTQDRTLTITTGDASRTLTLSGDATISGTNTGDQTITLSGDVSGSGTGAITTTIGSDKITEAMLKAVNAAADEDILTYETTTGDFEWHTPGELSLVATSRQITIAGTTNEITSSAGAQDLSADRTWTLSLPTALTLSGKELQGGTLFLAEGATANEFEATFALTDPTADITITFPNASGEVSLLGQAISSAEITDGEIVNNDVSASAAIALSKLAAGTDGQIIVANGSGVPAYVAMSGDATIVNTGAVTVADDSHNHTTTTISGLSLANDLGTFASSDLAGRLTDESGGSGVAVFNANPTLVGATINGGDLALSDGSGDSPAATFTPQTGTAWSIYAVDSDDDLNIVSASTTSTENIDMSNPGAGVVNLTVEGAISGSNISGTNSGDVTLAGTPNYITIAGQVITREEVALTTHTSGNYVASVATTSPLSGGAAGSEGATLTLSISNDGVGPTQIDETANYTWTGKHDFDSAEILSTAALQFEGATDDNIYTIFSITDPTSASKTITFQNATGTVPLHAAAVTDLAGAGLSLSGTTLTFDATELTNVSWSAGGSASFTHTYNVSTGTDPVITFGDGIVNISTGNLQEGGAHVYTTADGSLAADDLSDNNITDLADVTITSAAAAHILVRNSGNTAFENVAMSGDATISAAGALTIASNAVTFAKFQDITDNRLLGRSAGTDGDMQLITVGTGLSLSGGTLSATGGTASWSGLTAPTDATSFVSDGTGEIVTFDFQAAFTTGNQFTIKQTTGNPSGGSLLAVQAADANVSPIMLLENAAAVTIATGLQISATNASGVLTTAIDLSDDEIVTALALGSNDVTVGGATISSSEFAVLDGGIDLSSSEATGTLAAARFPALTGDVTTTAGNLATTIAADKVLESHLKAVNAAVDEDILTYESTTGDFEWHTPAELSLVSTSRQITIAGTTNEITSSAGAQDLSADRTWTLSLPTTLALSTKELQGGTLFIAEGATANTSETTFNVTDPTADRTITFPNYDGTVIVSNQGNKLLYASASLDYGSIASQSTATLTITVTGAATGDACFVGPPSTLETGLWPVRVIVTSANTVTIYLFNGTAGSVDPAAATWKVVVFANSN